MGIVLNSGAPEQWHGVPKLGDTGDEGKVPVDRFQRLRDRIRQKELKRSAVSHEATSESIKVPRTSHEVASQLRALITGPSGTPDVRRTQGGTSWYAGGGGSRTVGRVTSPTPRADP